MVVRQLSRADSLRVKSRLKRLECVKTRWKHGVEFFFVAFCVDFLYISYINLSWFWSPSFGWLSVGGIWTATKPFQSILREKVVFGFFCIFFLDHQSRCVGLSVSSNTKIFHCHRQLFQKNTVGHKITSNSETPKNRIFRKIRSFYF